MKKSFITLILLFAFTFLQAHVNLNYPEGGEVFNAGQQVTIEWEIVIPHDTQNWDLYLSLDGGNTWDAIRLDIGVDTLEYEWTVPDVSSTQARVKVVMDNTGANYEDESENFTITGSSGIHSSNIIPGLKIYPNPARGFIYMEPESQIDIKDIQLIDLNGKVARTYSVNELDGRLNIPLNGVSPGVFFIYIRSDDHYSIQKIFIINE